MFKKWDIIIEKKYGVGKSWASEISEAIRRNSFTKCQIEWNYLIESVDLILNPKIV